MRLQAVKPKYWLAVALVTALAMLIFWVMQPSAALTGVSLESAGYSLAALESARFDNPCPEHAEYPLDFHIAEGDHMRRYAEHLAGSYTVIYAPMPFSGTGAELVPLLWLQAVRVDDIRGLNPTIDTKNGPSHCGSFQTADLPRQKYCGFRCNHVGAQRGYPSRYAALCRRVHRSVRTFCRRRALLAGGAPAYPADARHAQRHLPF